MAEPIKSSQGDSPPELRRAEAQATLSAIGDVSIAASDAVGQVTEVPRGTRWLPLLGFLMALYLLGSLAAIYALKSAPWVQAFVAPLPLVLAATLVFWRRQVWKFRARDWQFKEKECRNALNSLAHETANGLNAIRANLAGLKEADSSRVAAEHMQLVEHAQQRVEAALEKVAAGQPRS